VTLYSTGGSSHLTSAWNAYRWLEKHQQEFDVLHFHDWQAPGYFVMQTKRQGRAFGTNLIITSMHCPDRFYRHGNMMHPFRVRSLIGEFMEREQVLGSDIIIRYPSKIQI
jgi:hypothetical protein